MACEVPVIASRVTGIPELIESTEDGLLVEPADPAALCRSIERLMDDRELYRELAAKGRQKVIRDFDLRRSSRTLLELFSNQAGAATEARVAAGSCVGGAIPGG
jgi:glycosyltransferase involved in cell wall biosynthesis